MRKQCAPAMAWLRSRIEDMSALPPQHAVCAYTHRRTEFIAVRSADLPRDPSALRDGVEVLISTVRHLRAEIAGPALLTWRRVPELAVDDGKWSIYFRLAFESDLCAVGDPC